MVSQVLFYNQEQKYPQIQQDVRMVKEHVKKADTTDKGLFYALESLPPIRRIASLGDKMDNGDTLPAVGLVGLALMNLPEDMRDIESATNQIRGLTDKTYKYDPLYNRKTHQHAFSFFRGTWVEKRLHKSIDKGNKFAEKLYNMDKLTLDNTKFGEKVQNIFGIEKIDVKSVEKIKDFKGDFAKAYQFKSKIFGGEITARAMKRLPLLSVAAIALLEIPKIFKAMNKGETIGEQAGNTAKQTVKSSINATSTLVGIGYGGAIGAKYAGATGSLIGMGVGAILGSKLSEKLQGIIA
ncbi:MAG: hypothetical protein PHE78_07735 [Candidatus Gastranaerophilales bacterium]|nr:hypothetical protein [Candidatus Gastranaerophilales bacterium]